ncbi:hypothetical protein FZC76_04220 [Sutcliffiella horikoshii]|uniref:DUF2232 domain-containing protein n=1 Tax=Sutcliffiella horikoshii TaxID=79883 RepID=A0A5D4T3G4_9BACI|nr:hypothetical protein [Sutcliffiella horikoshii]TYS69451.1 hypothetical protein FZC76_04220 [Sutcliffiella horikoshii]
MKTREITLLGVMAALCVASMQFLPYIMPFLFIVISLTFTRKQSCLLGAVLGLLSFFIYGKIMALTSIVMLPAVALATAWGRDHILLRNTQINISSIRSNKMVLFTFFTFVVQLIVNILSEIATSIVFSFGFTYVIASLPISIALSAVAAILVGLLALPLWKVSSKIYWGYTVNN